MENLIEVKNLKKYFKTNRGLLHAVDDVSFKIPKGRTLGVVGESGCGKSTLGRTVIHLHEKTGGEIWFEGKNISDVNKQELKSIREDMQMIFQDPFSSLNPRMSVSQLIAEPLLIYKKCSSKQELEQKVMKLMDTVGQLRDYIIPIRMSWTEDVDRGLVLHVPWLWSLNLLYVMSLYQL